MTANQRPPDPARPSVRLRVEVWLRRNGWVLPAGGCLLLAAVVVAPTYLAQARDRERALRAEVAALQQKRASPPMPSGALPAAPPGQALHMLLAQSEAPAAQMLRIAGIAREHGISLPRGQYTLNGQEPAGIEGTAVSLSFVAAYPRARQFVESLLREFPNASVDRLTFSRDRVQGAEVEIGLHLTLWRMSSSASDGAAR